MGWNIQIPDAEYYDHNTPGEVVEPLVREIAAQRAVAIDSETDGLIKWKSLPYYWSLSWEDMGRERRVMMPASTLEWFTPLFKERERAWVFANAKFDVHMFANRGVDILGKLHDTAVMHALLYEEQPHDLKSMAKQVLGWRWTDFQDTFGSLRKGTCECGANVKSHKDEVGFCKKTGCLAFRQVTPLNLLERMAAADMHKLVDYASNDAYGTWKVYLELKKQLEAEPTWGLFVDEWPYIRTLADYFFNVEVPFTRALFTCERNGIKVDRQYLEELSPKLLGEIQELRTAIVQEAGYLINPGSDYDLREYFFEKLKLPVRRWTKGGKSGVKSPSVDAAFLESVRDDVKLADLVLQLKSLVKTHSTYVEEMPNRLDPQDRVHPQLNQDIARCMPAGELVLTNRGYLPVEQVVIGDLVIAHTGKPRKVVDRSTHTHKPIWRVRLANGLILRTTGNHEYKTADGWIRADALKIGTEVFVHSDSEEWAPIPEWPYQISSWGRVKSCKTGRVLTLQPKGEWGHLKITLSRNGAQARSEDRRDFAVHRLVIQAFGQGGKGAETRHLNGISWDNTIRNLAYGTPLENRQDALRHGTMSQRRAGRTRLTEADIDFIRSAKLVGQPPSKTAKLTWQLAEVIRAEFAGLRGEKSRLAQRYGVTVSAISALLSGKTYNRTREENLGFDTQELAERFGVTAGYIREIRSGAKCKPEDYIQGAGASFYLSQVVEIALESDQPTYGLTVEEDHSHITGGIVTHNTGRLSSSDPNLQNIPTGEKDKKGLRRTFIANKHTRLLVYDYDQLEMRLLAAASMDEGMCNGFRDPKYDIHADNVNLMFGTPYSDVVLAKKTDKQVKQGTSPADALTEYLADCLAKRDRSKTLGFGLNYGMKEKALARRMGVGIDTALDTIERYMNARPAVSRFYEEAIGEARETGFAYTILGRRRRLVNLWSTSEMDRWQAERQATNLPIQGGAADVCKLPVILIDEKRLDLKYDCRMLLQVHDELIFELPEEAIPVVQPIIKEWMEHPFTRDLACPLTVASGAGVSWGTAK